MQCDRIIAWCAHRYALGRMTYVPSHVADWLLTIWDELPEGERIGIRRETQEAIDQGRAGMDCDVETWTQFLEKTKDKTDEAHNVETV
jgi:hypothetical protein